MRHVINRLFTSCFYNTSGIKVNGAIIVQISDNAAHLGHNISTSDYDSMISAAKKAFWKW